MLGDPMRDQSTMEAIPMGAPHGHWDCFSGCSALQHRSQLPNVHMALPCSVRLVRKETARTRTHTCKRACTPTRKGTAMCMRKHACMRFGMCMRMDLHTHMLSRMHMRMHTHTIMRVVSDALLSCLVRSMLERERSGPSRSGRPRACKLA